MNQTVCFTGHRHVPDETVPLLYERLTQVVEELIENGATVFRTGGALGFDTIAAMVVLSCRLRHPHIRLELILPCPSQTQNWSSADKCVYDQILSQADSHRFISQGYFAGVLQMRNRALVEGADICVAYLTNSHGGGTAFTAALALKKGLKLINLQDVL